MYTLELDCPPGAPRPDDLIDGVLKDTGLTLGEPTKFFGNFCWEIPADQNALYLKNRETIKARIEALYNEGVIRYGSW